MKVEKYQELTKINVFNKITGYDIYREIIGADLELEVAINSPLRKDNNPSFCVYEKSGTYRHIDYSRSELSGDAIDFVMQKYMMNYDQALRWINERFGLGLEGSKVSETIRTYSHPKQERKDTLIQVSVKKYTQTELDYWGQYGITYDDLKGDNVYSINKLWINRRLRPLHELSFAYYYPTLNKFKIYSPLEQKGHKWLSNIPLSHIENLTSIEGKGIITKSKKDRLVLSKFIPQVANVQNESLSAFTSEVVDSLSEAKIWINFDADERGKENSIQITLHNNWGFKHLNTPDYLLPGIKDFSDWYKHSGPEPIRQFLTSKGII